MCRHLVYHLCVCLRACMRMLCQCVWKINKTERCNKSMIQTDKTLLWRHFILQAIPTYTLRLHVVLCLQPTPAHIWCHACALLSYSAARELSISSAFGCITCLLTTKVFPPPHSWLVAQILQVFRCRFVSSVPPCQFLTSLRVKNSVRMEILLFHLQQSALQGIKKKFLCCLKLLLGDNEA